MSNHKKELKQIRRDAEKRGWNVTVNNGGNRLRWCLGDKIVFSAVNPNDNRAVANIRACLKQVEEGRRTH